jgi:GNAT superfamily N-acetyltransferase
VRATELGELAAMRDLLAEAPGAALAESGGSIALCAPELPDARELNRILGLERLEQLDELSGLYRGARFWVSLDPDAGLDDALRERGFEADYPWQKFVREPASLRWETDVRIAEADERFGEVFLAGYGLPASLAGWFAVLPGRPGWHCLSAYDGDEPVAAGALFVVDGIGWLGFGATLPQVRGRGAQSALLAARVTRAHELGVEVVVTETGAPRDGQPGPSYRNILRAGFREAYLRPNYRSPS